MGPGDKLGKHEVIRRIAVGSVAELYLTRTVGAEGLEKLACVKRVLPQVARDASFVATFASEARLAATLSHPNVAQVIDVGQEDGEAFFAMEYVHGEDLGRLVTASSDNGVPISLDCALTLAAGLCAGLHHAHEKAAEGGKPVGMVHRDVSPTNIIVSYDGAVKLVDFGIARAAGESSAPGAVLKGKISYMSPEQARGRGAIDRRSDVFSVGTILYQLTTGQLPFIDETEPGVRLKISSSDPPLPSQLVPGYAPALEAIVMRALARDPDGRFATAMAMQNQIEDFAHERRLRVSPIVLARLMSTLFPARLEEWDHARAQGAFFVEQHVVRTLTENGKTADAGDAHVAEPLGAAAGAPGEPQSPRAPEVEVGDPTELGPQPRLAPSGAQPPRPSRPSQAPGGPQPRAASQPRPGRSSPPGTNPLTSSQARATRPSQPPLASVLPSLPQRPSRPSQAPPITAPPRAGRPSQQPIAAAQPQAAERAMAAPTPAPPQPAWPPAPSAHPAPQGAGWAPAAPSLQPWAASSSPEASPWAGTSSPEASPWAGTSSPEASPWAGTSSPEASPWAGTSSPEASPWGAGHGSPSQPIAAQSLPSDPFGSQPSSQDLRIGRIATPVPGMPGAVPIMATFSAPPVPSGGTLVSSATLAGNQPPPVRPVHGPFGQGGLDGFAGQSGLDNFTNHSMPGGPTAPGAGMLSGLPGGPTARTPIPAPPTLQMRAARTSSLPLVVLALAGAVAVAAGAWVVVGREDTAGAPSTATARPEPAAATPAPAAKPPARAAEPAPAGAPEPATAAPEPNAAATPSAPSEGDESAREPAVDAPTPPAPGTKPEPPKKKPVAAPDARAKAAKPKLRVEPKRGAKSQPKEQPWNDDSPFMPVATPKR